MAVVESVVEGLFVAIGPAINCKLSALAPVPFTRSHQIASEDRFDVLIRQKKKTTFCTAKAGMHDD